MVDVLLPAGFSPWLGFALVLAAALTSMVTASLGAGGGVILLALLALSVPPSAIIPVHGLVQLGSNVNRMLMLWRHVDLRTIAWFAPGVALGAWLASLVLVELPANVIQLCIAGFILLLVWGPAVPRQALGAVGTVLASTFTSFISMFVGATGPLVAAYVKQQQSHKRFGTVATFAAAMSLQHAPKALVYGAAGFAFREWLGLVAVMIAAGALGTWLGIRLLGRLGDRRFDLVFRILLTALALRLFWQAAS
ncbi:MAG: sulfite exporter TauE/SafE family protein [Ectothiorhodospiraceae bacterium]|nr:sulfite exporter TauE/SafE family protein [Ectothiorhodospiraceae bacterium]